MSTQKDEWVIENISTKAFSQCFCLHVKLKLLSGARGIHKHIIRDLIKKHCKKLSKSSVSITKSYMDVLPPIGCQGVWLIKGCE